MLLSDSSTARELEGFRFAILVLNEIQLHGFYPPLSLFVCLLERPVRVGAPGDGGEGGVVGHELRVGLA